MAKFTIVNMVDVVSVELKVMAKFTIVNMVDVVLVEPKVFQLKWVGQHIFFY